MGAEARRIRERLARQLVLDARTPDEIHGYGDHDLPS